MRANQNNNQEIVWSFVMAGTGVDIIEARKRAIDESIELAKYLNDSKFLSVSKKCRVLAAVIENMKKEIPNNSVNAFNILQNMISLRKILTNFSHAYLGYKEIQEYIIKEVTIPFKRMLIEFMLNLDEVSIKNINAYLNHPFNSYFFDKNNSIALYNVSPPNEGQAFSNIEIINIYQRFYEYLEREILHNLNSIEVQKLKNNFQIENEIYRYFKDRYEMSFNPPASNMKVSVNVLQGVGTKNLNPNAMNSDGTFKTGKEKASGSKKQKNKFEKSHTSEKMKTSVIMNDDQASIQMQATNQDHSKGKSSDETAANERKENQDPIRSSKGEQILTTITGSGEQQNVNHCMHLLHEAERKGNLPKRIVLAGHSRGAAAQIMLARKIYLQYGDRIKIAMNLSDPVPGPGGFVKKSRKVIPPNVDSLVIVYAAHEKKPFFEPLSVDQLHFDPTKTTVMTVGFRGDHNSTPETLKSLNDEIYVSAKLTTHYSLN